MSVESVRRRLEAATPGPFAASLPSLHAFERPVADLFGHSAADLFLALRVIEAAKALSVQQEICEDTEFTTDERAHEAFEKLYACWNAMRVALDFFEAAD